MFAPGSTGAITPCVDRVLTATRCATIATGPQPSTATVDGKLVRTYVGSVPAAKSIEYSVEFTTQAAPGTNGYLRPTTAIAKGTSCSGKM